MRNGLKVYDADTHVRPSVETLKPYLSKKILDSIPDLDEHTTPIKVSQAGEPLEPPYRNYFRFRAQQGWGTGTPRILGDAGPKENAERHFQKFMGTTFPALGCDDFDPEARLRDMDTEGADAHFIVSNAGVGHSDPELEMEFVRAHHRWLSDFCNTDPNRLKSCVSVTPVSIEDSVAEINQWGDEPWAVAIHPALPLDYPLDHPDLHPIWKAAQEKNLAVIHHSFAAGYPGYRDLWENPFIGRCASHPWGGMRAMCSFIGGGLMDKFPEIRYGILECGFGWLPFWARRMDDQAIYVGYVPELKYKMSEYLANGRFFCSIEMHEGAELAKSVNEFIGDHVLMFASDYSHAESRFPESADQVLAWQNVLGMEATQKMFWDNPVRFFGDP